MPRRLSILLGVAIVVVALAIPPASFAAITATNVTTPKDGTVFFGDATQPSTFSIEGTANADGNVDILCYLSGEPISVGGPQTKNVAVVGGHFSVNASIPALIGETCRIRAVPAGTTPSDVTPFTGPRVAVGGRKGDFHMPAGPNAGQLVDYDIYSMRLAAGADIESLGGCGQDNSFLIDSVPNVTEVLSCVGWKDQFGAPSTRPALTVDGVAGYGPEDVAAGNGAYFNGFGNNQPFPVLTYSFKHDASNGDLTITETDRFVKCAPDSATFPPTSSSCSSFADAGVKLVRSIVVDHGMTVTRFDDRWTTTDGHSHPLSMQYSNDFNLGRVFGTPSMHFGYRFPGQSTYSEHASGDVINGPLSRLNAAFIKDTTAADGDPTTGQAAVVWSAPPASATFTADRGFDLTFNGTVQANRPLDLKLGYASALTTAGVSNLVRGIKDAFSAPTVTITSPANGARRARSSTPVRGFATDNFGVTSLTVNGHPVKLGPHGAFATRVALAPGVNKITAVAKDAAGNATQAQVSVTDYPPGFKHLAKSHVFTRKGHVFLDTGLGLRCPNGAGDCSAAVKGISSKTLLSASAGTNTFTFARAHLTVGQGKVKRIVLALTDRGTRALTLHDRIHLPVTAAVRVGRLGVATLTRKVTVKRPK